MVTLRSASRVKMVAVAGRNGARGVGGKIKHLHATAARRRRDAATTNNKVLNRTKSAKLKAANAQAAAKAKVAAAKAKVHRKAQKDRALAKEKARKAAERAKAAKARASAKAKELKAAAAERAKVAKARAIAKALAAKAAEKARALRQEAKARERAAREAERSRVREAGRKFCACCGDVIVLAATAKSLRRLCECDQCRSSFHAQCMYPPVFLGPKPAEHGPCLLCLSGRYADSNSAREGAAGAAAAALLRDGYVTVPLSSRPVLDVLKTARTQVTSACERLLQKYDILLNSGDPVPSLATGYKNFRQRGAGRFEVVDPSITDPVFALVTDSGSFVKRVLQLAMRPSSSADLDDLRFFSSGCMYATAGAAGQNWHSDGPPVSLTSDEQLPYAVNVFVPLVDVNPSNGTHFVRGSHRPTKMATKKSQGEHSAARLCAASPADLVKIAASSVIPTVSVGSALLFDYRVVHRGLPNVTSNDRPVLYCTLAQPWYKGDENFSEARYKGVLQPVSPRTRRTREFREGD
jgi:hypothetical protein